MIESQQLYSLTEDTPFQPADIYQSNTPRLVLRGLTLIFLALAIYIPTLGTSLLWPDEVALMRDIALRSGDGPGGVWSMERLWFEPPLAKTLLYLEHRAGGQATQFHLVNIFIHTANGVLLWLLLRRLELPGAWLAAALFMIHPVHAQSIAWVAQQGRLWAALFGISSMLLFLRAAGIPALRTDGLEAEQNRFVTPLTYLASLIFYIAAILCQPALLVIAPLLACIKVRSGSNIWTAIRTVLPFMVVALLVAIFRVIQSPSFTILPLLTSINDALWSSIRIVWPIPLVRADWQKSSSELTLGSYGGMLMIIAALAITITVRWRFRVSGPLATVFCVICLVPTVWNGFIDPESASLVPGRDAVGYLISIPIIVALIGILVITIEKLRNPLPIALTRLASGVLLIAAFGTACWIATKAHATTESVWVAAVNGSPSSAIAHGQLATWYLKQKDVDAAEKYLRDIDLSTCDEVTALIAGGRIMEARNQTQAAIDAYSRAMKFDPSPKTVTYLAGAYLQNRQTDRAIEVFETALARHPTDPGIRNDFGLLLAQQNKPDDAAGRYREAIEIDAHFTPPRINLANILFAQGKLAEAAEQLQAVVKIDPMNYEAFHNAGIMLCQLQDYTSAEPMLRAAVRLRPDLPEAHNDLAVALVANNKLPDAIFQFNAAIALNPEYAEARQNLEVAQQRLEAQEERGRSVRPK